MAGIEQWRLDRIGKNVSRAVGAECHAAGITDWRVREKITGRVWTELAEINAVWEETETETAPGLVVVAVREWWNPAGHFVVSARIFDPATCRVAVIHPDGHGQAAVISEARRVLDLPVGQRFVFDTVRVARRCDLHIIRGAFASHDVSTVTGVTA